MQVAFVMSKDVGMAVVGQRVVSVLYECDPILNISGLAATGRVE